MLASLSVGMMLFSCAHRVFSCVVFHMNFRSEPFVSSVLKLCHVDREPFSEKTAEPNTSFSAEQKIHTDAATVLWCKEASGVKAEVCFSLSISMLIAGHVTHSASKYFDP